MDRQYLQSFNNQQLQHYLKTLKRRVNDLRELTLHLGKENQQLGIEYEALTKEKFQVYQANQQKKKGWGKWINKGKQKLGNIFHKVKKQQKKAEIKQEKPEFVEQQIPKQLNHQHIIQAPSNENKQVLSKKLTLQNFNFDDLIQIGKQKITGLFKKSKEGYHPNDKDNYQIQYANQQENLKQNVQLIREITGEHPEPQGKEESVQERQFKRRLLVEAQIARKADSSINVQAKKQEPNIVLQAVKIKEIAVKLQKKQQLTSQKVKSEHQNQFIVAKDVKQIGKNEVQTLVAEDEEENQYGVHFDSQMDRYELKQENLSQIVERQAQKAPQSQEDIEYSNKQSKP